MKTELQDAEAECLKLKKSINENHRLAQKAAGDAVERAVLTGELIGQWKELLPHGRFEGFVEKHFDGSLRTAQRYLLVAKRLNALPKTTRMSLLKSELSISELIELPKGAPKSEPAPSRAEPRRAAPEAATKKTSEKGKPGGDAAPISYAPPSSGPVSDEAADSQTEGYLKVILGSDLPERSTKYGKGTETVSAASLVDQVMRQHISPLARELTAIAKVNGGEGKQFKAADDGLNQLIVALREMREGKQ